MILQDVYRNDPWKVLCSCVLLNRCRGSVVKRAVAGLFGEWADPSSLAAANRLDVEKMVKSCGFQSRRADVLIHLSETMSDGRDPFETDGIGSYAMDSWNVFIGRDRTVVSSDKEIARYLKSAVPVEDLVLRLEATADRIGVASDVRGGRALELIEFRYGFDDGMFCRVDLRDDQEYVSSKMSVVESRLREISLELARDLSSRRCVLLMDQSGDEPNCLVAVQFQRRMNAVRTSAFYRSQDVSMVMKDCDILSRMTCMVCEGFPWVGGYGVSVFVGNLHRYVERAGCDNREAKRGGR